MAKKGKLGRYIGFKDIFQETMPKKPLELIKDIPQNTLVTVFANLNNELKQPLDFMYNFSNEFQIVQFRKYYHQSKNIVKPYLNAYQLLQTTLPEGTPIIFFHRPQILYALQEIMSLPHCVDKNFELSDNDISNLLRYMACVNENIMKFERQKQSKRTPLEELVSESLFVNELQIVVNIIMIFNWYVLLIKYLQTHPKLGTSIDDYFNSLGISTRKYLLYIGGEFRTSNNLSINRNTENNPMAERVLEYLSRRGQANQAHELDMVELKKSPVYKREKNIYTIMDFALLADKVYEQFIHDFWFDYVKPKNIVNRKLYGAIIGKFFEDYCGMLLKEMFSWWKYPAIKCGDETNIKVNGETKRYCDLYFRQNKKIMIGEMKATGIYAGHREGFAASLYETSPEDFYKSFGLHQLINYMRKLQQHGNDFDDKFPSGSMLDIYPVLILNEKYFRYPLISGVFQAEMEKELAEDPIPNAIIRPITIFHLSDLEDMKGIISNKNLKGRSIRIWDLLESNRIKKNIPASIYYTLRAKGIKPTEPSRNFLNYIFNSDGTEAE